ncbi:(2Fe-2S) ferredoxin domain-containing protein [Microcella sp.]|uniref:(2Fe-2S) ferredoxin domain-containing protein n=1 Tax=Microcella sp. TaxID=1913979 RepID=UPI00299F6967|nr:(2Fe-2S) ferredoxin domain-containing protein [Microcella sp.]MDX2026977.1 (2Fe-2S) ferredoxin domain-containing protein [Microcella sp.]
MARLSSMGLELEEVAEDEQVTIAAIVALAEDRGRPPGHYLAAIPLATELRVASDASLELRVCAGNCQKYGALGLLDHLVEKVQRDPSFAIVPVTCLDRCDHAPACELRGGHGQLVVAPATPAALDEALAQLTS